MFLYWKIIINATNMGNWKTLKAGTSGNGNGNGNGNGTTSIHFDDQVLGRGFFAVQDLFDMRYYNLCRLALYVNINGT